MAGSTQLRRLWHRFFGHGKGPYTFAGYALNPYRHYLFCRRCEGRGLKGLQIIVYTRRPCLCR